MNTRPMTGKAILGSTLAILTVTIALILVFIMPDRVLLRLGQTKILRNI